MSSVFFFICITPGSWTSTNSEGVLIIVRAPCHNHTDTSTLIIICFIHHISSNAIESLPCSWHNLTRTINPIRYEGSIDCKTNVLFHVGEPNSARVVTEDERGLLRIAKIGKNIPQVCCLLADEKKCGIFCFRSRGDHGGDECAES